MVEKPEAAIEPTNAAQQPIIYQNTTKNKQETDVPDAGNASALPHSSKDSKDVFDGVDSIYNTNTNPFTNAAGPSNANPFSFHVFNEEDELALPVGTESEKDNSENNTALVKGKIYFVRFFFQIISKWLTFCLPIDYSY